MEHLLKFTATGDCIISRRLHHDSRPDFEPLVNLIKQANASFANVELVTPGKPRIPSSEYGGIHLAMPPFVLDELNKTGFNLFNLAHNHALDFHIPGLVDTMEELKNRDMTFAGVGRNLGQARSPRYLDIPAGRVALIAATSSFTAGARAGAKRTDFEGRPGVNPLRFKKQYVVTEKQMSQLQQIDEAMGTNETRKRRRDFGLPPQDQPDAYKFLERPFVIGDEPDVRTTPNQKDVQAICCWIDDASRQADFVVMSLHCHQGPADGTNDDQPAEFIIESARAFIDAGADVFVGHGPHMLRGIEIYKGKPIFYSLGNFMFMCENIEQLPMDMYERYHLSETDTPADVFDFESSDEAGKPKAFHADERFWETILPVCTFHKRKLTKIDMVPVTLQLNKPRTQRGAPVVADKNHAEKIFENLIEVSAEFATDIHLVEHDDTIKGRIRL